MLQQRGSEKHLLPMQRQKKETIPIISLPSPRSLFFPSFLPRSVGMPGPTADHRVYIATLAINTGK